MLDVLIVGAGPAGLSAAGVCARFGLHVKVVDEFIKPGGRLLGQLHQEPDGTWWNGLEAAEKLLNDLERYYVEIECGVSVYNIKKEQDIWKVYTTKGILQARSVLLATGAAEAPLPLPGWTLPGVMSIGAAQVMTNVHRVRVGQRGVVIGINVLAVAISRELQLAGIEVEGLFLPGNNAATRSHASPLEVLESLLRVAHLAPSTFIRYGSKAVKTKTLKRMALRFYPKKGVKIWGIPVHLRKAVVEILGDQQVEGVRTVEVDPSGEPVRGTDKVIPADFACIAGGLYPLVELAAVSGCPFRYVPELGGHVPVHNEQMKTPLSGLYVAGNITGIEGAKVAMAQGRVAGFSILQDLWKGNREIEGHLKAAVDQVKSIRQKALIQFHPHIEQGRNRVYSAYSKISLNGQIS